MTTGIMLPPPTAIDDREDGDPDPRCHICGRYGIPRSELAWRGRAAHIPILERHLVRGDAVLLCLADRLSRPFPGAPGGHGPVLLRPVHGRRQGVPVHGPRANTPSPRPIANTRTSAMNGSSASMKVSVSQNIANSSQGGDALWFLMRLARRYCTSTTWPRFHASFIKPQRKRPGRPPRPFTLFRAPVVPRSWAQRGHAKAGGTLVRPLPDRRAERLQLRPSRPPVATSRR